jgi:DNA-binding transcriptional MerR regulator
MASEDSLDIRGLCRQAGVSPRTVHFYVQQGLLKGAGSRGPGSKYEPGQLTRLLLIRELQKSHVPLAEIRSRFSALTDDQAVDLLRQSRRGRPPAGGSALDYIHRVLAGGAARPARATPSAASSAPGIAMSRPAAAPAAPVRAAGDRSQWDRIVLAPDVELHVRRPQSRYQNRLIERLLSAAREVFGEEHS